MDYYICSSWDRDKLRQDVIALIKEWYTPCWWISVCTLKWFDNEDEPHYYQSMIK